MKNTALFLLAILTVQSLPARSEESSRYYYCGVPTAPYGETSYFSEVFRASDEVSQLGIENDYYDYVAARHDPSVSTRPVCMGPYDERREAEALLNQQILSLRRENKQIVLTYWKYRNN